MLCHVPLVGISACNVEMGATRVNMWQGLDGEFAVIWGGVRLADAVMLEFV